MQSWFQDPEDAMDIGSLDLSDKNSKLNFEKLNQENFEGLKKKMCEVIINVSFLAVVCCEKTDQFETLANLGDFLCAGPPATPPPAAGCCSAYC